MKHSRSFRIASWVLRGITAIILLQTLFFKFSGAKESVYIFETLGMEPWGRLGVGMAELFASILLLLPRTVPFGAILSLGVISGAIVTHVAKLGIALPAVGDKGELVALAIVVFLCSGAVLLLRRQEVPLWARLR